MESISFFKTFLLKIFIFYANYFLKLKYRCLKKDIISNISNNHLSFSMILSKFGICAVDKNENWIDIFFFTACYYSHNMHISRKKCEFFAGISVIIQQWILNASLWGSVSRQRVSNLKQNVPSFHRYSSISWNNWHTKIKFFQIYFMYHFNFTFVLE